jgi:hypothetical protein
MEIKHGSEPLEGNLAALGFILEYKTIIIYDLIKN